MDEVGLSRSVARMIRSKLKISEVERTRKGASYTIAQRR